MDQEARERRTHYRHFVDLLVSQGKEVGPEPHKAAHAPSTVLEANFYCDPAREVMVYLPSVFATWVDIGDGVSKPVLPCIV